MYKRLRIIVPAAQVLAFVAVYALRFAAVYPLGYYAQRLILKINYPLLPIWVATGYPVDRVTPHLPALWGWRDIAVRSMFGALVVSSVALFWYFVITEAQMRRHHKSMLRFSGAFKESLTVTLMFVLGVGALIYAYNSRLSWIPHARSQGSALELAAAITDQFLGGLVLITWGAVLIGLAVDDLVTFLKGRAQGTTNAGSPSTPRAGTGT
jgi:magnesium-transporting ATPase (P-type)